MGKKRKRPSDEHDDDDDNDVLETARGVDRRVAKRRKHRDDQTNRILWPPEKFDLAFVAWACQQFPDTGFCLDFRARWLKSRQACPLCDKYAIRKIADLDSMCKDGKKRKAVSEEFPTRCDIETLERMEYIMCGRPHGAQSFDYVRTESDKAEVKVTFEGVVHLGWPELCALLETCEFSDLVVDLNQQSVSLKLTPRVKEPLDPEEVGMALMGYYLRFADTTHVPIKHDALQDLP